MSKSNLKIYPLFTQFLPFLKKIAFPKVCSRKHWYLRMLLIFVKELKGMGPQVGCMRQALGPGALGRPRGSGWRGRWEGGSGWGTHVNPWLFYFNV